MDYVPEDEIAGFLVDFFLLCKLVSITPLYVYLSKNQLFEVFYKDTPSPKWLQHGFNVLFLIYIAIMGNFNIQPTVLIGLNGSYGGLILIYIVPIAIHLKCIYTSNCKINHKKSYKKSSVAN
jgi:sodium-coupled neutral amino acid transporter 9